MRKRAVGTETVYILKPNKMLLVFCEIGWIPSDKLMLSSSFPPHESMSPTYPVLFGVFSNKGRGSSCEGMTGVEPGSLCIGLLV